MRFLDYLQAPLKRDNMRWLTNNVVGKKYKGKKITNAVFDDKKGTMVRFWVRDRGKIKEFRPIPKDELIKVLK
jgi:hypothetical protein